MRRAAFLALLPAFGCAIDEVSLGSNVIWATSHESSTLEDWSGDLGGGPISDDPTLAPVAVTEPAHSGAHAAFLASNGQGDIRGTGLQRRLVAGRANYAAWFYLPRAFEPGDQMSLLVFASPAGTAPAMEDQGVRLTVRANVAGDLIVHLLHEARQYQGLPLPDPPPRTRAQRWFHVEVELEGAGGDNGFMRVWLNGREAYTLDDRPLDFGPDGYFAVLCDVDDASVGPREVVVDDVIIARSRITPDARP